VTTKNHALNDLLGRTLCESLEIPLRRAKNAKQNRCRSVTLATATSVLICTKSNQTI
jgi:hypothetical protein